MNFRKVGTVTIRFLSRNEVADLIGVRPATLSRYKLPPADVMVGCTRGWARETIIEWNASRPGRGVGGGRPQK